MSSPRPLTARAIARLVRRVPQAWWRAGGVTALVVVLVTLGLRAYLDVGEARVPAVTGAQLEEATRLLVAAGFRTEPTLVDSPEPVGTVVSQSPAAGLRVRSGRVVEVLVSAAASVSVPEVLGLTLEAAEAVISESGLALGAVDRRVDSAEAWRVIGQQPAPGSMVVPGAPVALAISAGPERPRRVVPALSGLDLDGARRALEAAGLGLMDVVPVEAGGGRAGTVADQQPAAGANVAEGSFVTVYLRAEDQRLVRVPDLVGFSAVRARAMLLASGLRVRQERVRPGVEREVRTILTQQPPGASLAFAGTGVLLEVSGGPDLASPGEILPDRTLPLRFVLPVNEGFGPATEVRVIVRDSAGEREVARVRVDPGQEVDAQFNVVGEALVQIFVDGVLYLEYQV